MADYWDSFPAEFRDEIRAIHTEPGSNAQLNKRLVNFYIANGDRVGLPHDCQCLVTDELRQLLKQWGWSDDAIAGGLRKGYVICRYTGGAGPAFITPGGEWIGAVEWDLAWRLRAAWVEQNT